MHAFAVPLRFQLIAVLSALLLIIAACAPQATPTPTPSPEPEPSPTAEEVIEEEAEEAEEAEAEEPAETETAVATEDAEPAEDEATEEDDADASATEAADTETDAADEPAGSPEEGYPAVVGVTSTRVRAQPAVRGEVIVELSQGDELIVLGETTTGYVLVRTADGQEGWVSKQTVRFDNPFISLPVIEPES